MREEARQMTADVTVYICDDGTEFAPELEGMNSGNLKWRQADAKARAERHQKEVERRHNLAPMMRRLFGSRAEEVEMVMDAPSMRCLERRWRVLETIDNELQKSASLEDGLPKT